MSRYPQRGGDGHEPIGVENTTPMNAVDDEEPRRCGFE